MKDGEQTSDRLIGQAQQDWPIGIDEWDQRARSVLSRAAYDWVSGGAGEEWTMDANRDAFRRWQLRPQVLRNTAERDISIEVLGTRSAAPFLLAPIGGQTVAHREGERAVARAARDTGIPLIISQAASHSMEEIASESIDAPYWYQLYWISDHELVSSLVGRAEECGCRAIVLTVDSPIVGWRDRDQRNGFIPFLRDEGIRQYTTDPVFQSRLDTSQDSDPGVAGAAVVKMFPNVTLQWEDLGWLRNRTPLPILLKGILRSDDALRAYEEGIDGIIVSNHGGRQLDGAIASLDALPEVRRAVGDDALVLMDGGIRRGTDVVKALALGADAVLVGRPYIFGLAAGGKEGVGHVLATLTAEVDSAFVLVGANTTRDLDRSFVSLIPRDV